MIIETDIGNDPDDFFTLCYLAAAGIKIDAVVIVPGGPGQVAITKLLLEEAGIDAPVGVSHPDKKHESNGVHEKVVQTYRSSGWAAKHDGLGHDIIASVANEDSEFLVIGPVTNFGNYLKSNPDYRCKRATMQGGFLPYHLHHLNVTRLPNFEGKGFVPTFNLNGNRPAGLAFLGANIEDRRMVGKNVCHTVVFGEDQYKMMQDNPHPAAKLFMAGMRIYLDRHPDGKKFHDPTAAVCHLHPEIGTWVRGRTIKVESGWSSVLDLDGDNILADIDRDKLWHHIATWS